MKKNKKGRQWKRAEDALRAHLAWSVNCSNGYVVNTHKSHPNYFVAKLYDPWEKTWDNCYLAYISVYQKKDGSWAKIR